MALSLGSALATKVYLGATEVSLAYLGATQVYTSVPPSFLLDDYTGAAAGYSLRNLSSSWTTSDVVEVRRSSDNATSGFTATEVSDGTMLAWVGTGGTDNGFVTTWYDQSGNAENVVQATTTKQPKIVSAGVAVVDNGKPSIDTRTTCFLTNNTIVGSQYDTTFAVGRTLGTANAFMHDGDSVNNMSVVQFSTEYFRLWNGAATITASDYPLGNQYLVYTKANNAGTDDEIAINGNSPLVDAGGSNTRSGLFIGSVGAGGSSPWNGYISEFILYKSDQSANRISIETNINNHFSIYTPAYSVEAQDYFNRLSAAGDTTYTAYKEPLANYIDSLVALGGAYWDDMLSAASFVGVGIQGITVPLRAGMVSATNVNNNFVAADLNQLTGLKGDGSTKYLATGVLDNDVGQNDYSMSSWVTDPVYLDNAYWMGSPRLAHRSGASNNAVKFSAQNNSSAQVNPFPDIVDGFIGQTRTVGTDFDWFINTNSGNFVKASIAPTGSGISVFAWGTGNAKNASRIATYHVGPALNLATLEGLQETLLSEIAAI